MYKYIIGWFKNLSNSGVGKLTIIDNNSKISRKARTNRWVIIRKSFVGDYSYIGHNSSLSNTTIGKFCSIADHVIIGLANHTLTYISTSPIFTLKNNALHKQWVDRDLITESSSETIIGNDVWIGSRVLIKSGVRVGDGAVIGAGAVVTKDVPPYSIVVGIPAKIVRYRFNKNIIDLLLETKWWDLNENLLKDKIRLFQSDIIDENLVKSI